MFQGSTRAALFALAMPLLAFGQPALAQDAESVADKLVELTNRGQASNSKYDSATLEGDTVIIKGFTALLPQPDTNMRADELHLVDAVVEADGGLSAREMIATGLEVTSPEAQMTIAEITGQGIRYPSPELPEAEFAAKARSAYAQMEIRGMVVTAEQEQQVPIDRIAINNEDIVDGLAHKATVAIEGIVIDLQAAKDGDARETAKNLGYDKITLGASVEARWDEPGSTLFLDRFTFGGEDIGTLTLSASIGGITRALLLSSNQEESSAHLQKVSLISASVHFENDSIVERLIAQQATDEGVAPEEIVAQTLQQLPDMAALIGDPDLAAQAVEAVSTFLRSPKNLLISAKPQAAVPVLGIVGAALMAPSAAVDMLKLEITANQ